MPPELQLAYLKGYQEMTISFADLTELTTLTPDDILLVRNGADNLDYRATLSTFQAAAAISTVHIRNFVTDTNTDVEALTAACLVADVIEFGGYTMNIATDFTLPVGARCKRWDLQGTTINLTDNAQILLGNVADDFAIIGDGATVNGNWKISTLTVKSAEQPTTVTVDDTSLFDVGDQISSSYSLRYLPNATDRTDVLGSFNTVASKTANTITFASQVLQVDGFDNTVSPQENNVLPAGTVLVNGRFDRSGLQWNGTGVFTVQGVTFINMPNAYAINVGDTTETARASIIDCEINGIFLDALRFVGAQLYMRNVKVRDVRDIAKQVLVWSNSNTKGQLLVEHCDWASNNPDAYLFCENGYLPDRTYLNCNFNGQNNKQFTPFNFHSDNCLTFEGRINSLDLVIAGKFTAINCTFDNFVRHVVGTSFINSDNWIQDTVHFSNCFLSCDGVYWQPSGAGTIDISPVTYTNCTLKGSAFKLGFGADKVTYSDCIILENFPVDGDEFFEAGVSTTRNYIENHKIIDSSTGVQYTCTQDSTTGTLLTNTSFFRNDGNLYYVESSATTTRQYFRGDYIFRTDNTRKYTVVAGGALQYQSQVGDLLTDTARFNDIETDIDRGFFVNTRLVGDFDFVDDTDVRFDTLILPNRDGDTLVTFQLNFFDGIDNTLLLEGANAASVTPLDLAEWFVVGTGETDVPNFRILVEGTDAVINYGAGESIQREYAYRLKSRRFDPAVGTTAPISMSGAFLADPIEGALVESTRSPGELKRVSLTTSADVNAAANSGATSISVNNVSTRPNAGDWISLNNSGSERVNFHEITAVSGSGTGPFALNISPAVVSNITTSTNSFLIQHDFINYPRLPRFEVSHTSGNEFYTVRDSWTDAVEFTTTSPAGTSGLIPYASFDGTDTITLPRGRYLFNAGVRLRQDSAGDAVTEYKASIRLQSTATGWSTIRSQQFRNLVDDSGTPQTGRLTVNPTLSGSFVLEEEANMTLEVYVNQPSQIDTVSNDERGAFLSFTKIG